MTCVTGVSGSGKSHWSMRSSTSTWQELKPCQMYSGRHNKDIEGLEQLDKVIDIDQSPIGRTPRSNPATYTGVFDL